MKCLRAFNEWFALASYGLWRWLYTKWLEQVDLVNFNYKCRISIDSTPFNRFIWAWFINELHYTAQYWHKNGLQLPSSRLDWTVIVICVIVMNRDTNSVVFLLECYQFDSKQWARVLLSLEVLINLHVPMFTWILFVCKITVKRYETNKFQVFTFAFIIQAFSLKKRPRTLTQRIIIIYAKLTDSTTCLFGLSAEFPF